MTRLAFTFLTLISWLVLSGPAFAGHTTSVGTVEVRDDGNPVKTLKINKVDVEVFDQLDVSVASEKKNEKLKLTGYSPRRHAILGNMYVIRSYVPETVKFSQSGVIAEITGANLKALRLNILASLSASSLRSAFTTSLRRNNIDPSAPEHADIKALLDKLTFNVTAGDVIDFVSVTRPDGSDYVAIAIEAQGNPPQLLEGAGNGLGMKFWKIWFGETADDKDMKRVKAALISQAKSAK